MTERKTKRRRKTKLERTFLDYDVYNAGSVTQQRPFRSVESLIEELDANGGLVAGENDW